ncbi:YdhK family protein [Lysinibacillus sp. SGAir0095]|uniref:YdhK family protein n=1 Tax=Lysinibacillus sp. SGAir0095 TaxID=2070463 RepID=UPI0010CCD714|nr:YdhK family protein [Lysinibacillus sp. SGAir0095]QCR32546.1 hypothetical protein C1N55_10340 [Lysinibacillus sp. SGAir0095]
MFNKKIFGIISLAAVISLSACANDNNEDEVHENSGKNLEESYDTDHSSMNHSSDGEIPTGLKESTNPTYPADSKAIIQTNHMEGMNGAEATIVGAFDTTVYSVTYTPTIGGEPVTKHKWVIHEELEEAEQETLKSGDQVTLKANHMEGMQGANATIDSATETTVYMVDYISTSGEEVKNHKWVTESELSAIE